MDEQKEKWTLDDILKPLACFALFLTTFPFIALVNGLVDNAAVFGGVPFQTLAAVLTGFLGYIFGICMRNFREKHPRITKAIFVGTAVIISYTSFFTLATFRTIVGIVIAVCCGITFNMGASGYDKNYSTIFDRAALGMNILFLCFSMVFLAVNDKPVYTDLYIAQLLLAASIYAIVKNQATIDRLMTRRRSKFSELPKRIRVYNLFLVSLLMIILALSVFFRRQIADFARILLGIILVIIRTVLWGIGYVLELIGSLFSSTTTSRPTMPDLSSLAGPGSGIGSNIFNIIFFIILAVILIYNFRRICNVVLSTFSGIRDALARMFERVIEEKDGDSGELYTDDEEYLTVEERKKREKSKTAENLRRRFRSAATPSEKLFAGYAAVLKNLDEGTPHPEKSDTPDEIKNNFGDEFVESEKITYAYTRAKYGNIPPSDDDVRAVAQAAFSQKKKKRTSVKK